MRTPPSGDQYELRHGDQEAVVVEVGAGLREYRRGGREVIDGFALDRPADGARGQALVPWPNRIRDGRYEWQAEGTRETLQLALTEVARGHAIHGLARWRSWRLVERGAARVALGTVIHPLPGYPFTLGIEIAYELGDGGLEVTTRAENLGARSAPYGVGFHPYLTLGGPTVDGALLRVPAARRLILDERAIPTSAEGVAGGPYDFREPRAIGGLMLDDCFCELARDADGRAWITLTDGGRSVALWLGEAYGYAMVYSGDTLEGPRRRRGLAIEPMTCAPNAFASGDGLVRLDPGAVHVAVWGIEP